MREGKTGIYSSHLLVPIPDSYKFSFIYKFSGDGKYYAKYSDGSYSLLISGSIPEVDIYIAGQILSGQRVVMLSSGKAIYYDTTDENNIGKVLGITNQAALTNELVEVIGDGLMTGFSGSLIPNSVYYAGVNGTLTAVIPSINIFQRIGVAINSNTLKVDFSEPIIII